MDLSDRLAVSPLTPMWLGLKILSVWLADLMSKLNEPFLTSTELALNVMGVEPAGTDEETALKGIEAMEDFYRRIHMPTNLRELGVNATDEDLVTMAHKCAVGVDGSMGSAKLLNEADMLAIYRASR